MPICTCKGMSFPQPCSAFWLVSATFWLRVTNGENYGKTKTTSKFPKEFYFCCTSMPEFSCTHSFKVISCPSCSHLSTFESKTRVNHNHLVSTSTRLWSIKVENISLATFKWLTNPNPTKSSFPPKKKRWVDFSVSPLPMKTIGTQQCTLQFQSHKLT